ncbi:MAG: hypothetical protein HOV80_16735 [Polyangiaceae bacterium]|nr:hypothetical protein [Polyangiaceae bacterium]
MAAQRRFVRELASDLEDDDQLTVLSVDHVTRQLTTGAEPVGDLDRSALDRSLKTAGENAAGDLRLDRAFEEATKLLSGSGGTVVYVGDGTPTGGIRSAKLLADKLPENVRFAGVALGDSTDMRVLDAIADERRGYATTIGLGDDLAHRAFDVVAALRTPCLRGIQATVLDGSGRPVEGATAHLLSERACDGEQVDVVARIPSGAKPQSIRIGARIDGSKEIFNREVPVSAPRVGASYLPRLWASREVESLLASKNAEENRSSIVTLASKHVLATPYTSLLVLENDAMYKQYGVEKREPTGFAVYQAPKKIDIRYEPMGSEAMALDSSWDLVHRLPTQVFSDPNVGAVGTGSGFGSGSGRLGGRHREVEQKKTEAPARFKGRVMNATPAASASPVAAFDPRSPAFTAKLSELASSDRQAATVATRMDRAQTKGEAADFGMIGLLDTTAVSQGFLQSAAFGGAYPMAFVSSSDPRLDDLTELAPSLLVQDFDLEREVVAAASGIGKTKRSPEALEALRKARAAIPDATYDVTDRRGTSRVSVGRATRWDTPRLGEITEYDGKVISSTYPELDLAVGRRVDGAGPWFLASDLAFVPPAEAALENLDVSLTTDGAVRIEAPRLRTEDDGQPELETLELRFDDAGRIREVRWLDNGAARRTTIDHEHGGDVVVHHPDGRVVRFRHAGARTMPPVSAVTTRIEVPVAVPARIDARLSTLTSGSDAWIAAQREKLAACAALADDNCGRTALTSILSARGKITRGEAVLASRAVARGSDDDAKKLLASLEASDPVRRTIAAGREWDSAKRRIAFAGLNLSKGPLGTWTSYRSILLDLENEGTVTPALVARVETFVKDPSARDELRYLLTKTTAERARWNDQKAGQRVWSLLSDDPDLGFVADRQRALLDSWSDPPESASLIVRSFETALDRGLAPTLDWQSRDIIKRGRGDVGYRLFWASWRKRLVDRGSAAQIVAFVRSTGLRPEEAGTNGLYDDLAPLITRFDAASDAGTNARIDLARQLVSMDRADSVERVLRPVLAIDEPPPQALDTASLGAEKLGKLNDAAKLTERAIKAAADREVPMDEVRARYGRLLTLHVKQGDDASPAQYATALAAAVQTARSWRREDPDNADVDLNVAAALDRLGSPQEAERQLYSIIDRHPGEGDGFAKVAAAMEARGNFDEALALWEQAASVEATNPTWLLRQAQLLRARSQPGDIDAARRALVKIHDTKWQDRFRPQTYEAEQLLNATKK